ncbi:MAG: GMC oxidoreductase, partial [Alphaproteobacteria bacterium]|nr:GMC oxidoreductase [Alphaproteobacteria bacterium]
EAGREVIVCGGAVESPHLLELSGIGARHRLEQMQIDCVADLPAVGENLQDHLGINFVYRSRIPSLNQELRPWYGKLWAGVKYLLARRGPLSLSLNQGGGFIHTRPGLRVPNIQLYCQAISTVTGRKGTRPLLNPDPFAGFALGLSNCRTSSRGSVHTVSADYRVAPEIQPNSFAAGEDLRDMLEGVKFLRHLASQPALAEVIVEELQPGPAVQSDEQLIADFKQRSGTVYHPCGTCRLGESAADSVVDLALRVHGIQGLRVVDASVFPAVITGNTNAPIMAIAARAADLILEQA